MHREVHRSGTPGAETFGGLVPWHAEPRAQGHPSSTARRHTTPRCRHPGGSTQPGAADCAGLFEPEVQSMPSPRRSNSAESACLANKISDFGFHRRGTSRVTEHRSPRRRDPPLGTAEILSGAHVQFPDAHSPGPRPRNWCYRRGQSIEPGPACSALPEHIYLGSQPALDEHSDTIADGYQLAHDVRGDTNRRAELPETNHFGPKELTNEWIKLLCGFVQYEYVRLGNDTLSERDDLADAFGQLPKRPVQVWC